MSELHVVLGASGGAGGAVVRELSRRGVRVRAVSRSGGGAALPGIERLAADVTHADDAVRACEGATVVYHCVNPPYTEWARVIPPLTESVLRGAETAGARLVVADNLYMYGEVSAPMTESTPVAATGRKGKLRAEATERLLAASADGRVRVTIGRASDFYGPGVTNAILGDRAFEPLLADKTLYLLGNVDVPHTYTFIDDFARALVTLGRHEEALGRVWHTPNAETLTTRENVKLAARLAGTTPTIRAARWWLVNVLGLVNPLFRELRETIHQFERPWVVDHSAYARAFGVDITPHMDAMKQTLDWYRDRSGG
jgi:nucleoside-diphosphate-sugar epimerase